MRSLEELLDMIPRFLAGSLSLEEKTDFEIGLKEHPILRQEAEELLGLKIGLDLSDEYAAEHVAPDPLVNYFYSPESLSEAERERISKHIEKCDQCRKAFKMTKKTHEYSTRQDPFWTRAADGIRDWLESAAIAMQPAPRFAVAALTLILLAIPAFVGFQELIGPTDGVTSITLKALDRRAPGFADTLACNRSDDIIRLTLTEIPVLEDATYRFSLFDSTLAPILSIGSLPSEAQITVDLPTAHLADGAYLLQLDESRNGIVSQLPAVKKQIFIHFTD